MDVVLGSLDKSYLRRNPGSVVSNIVSEMQNGPLVLGFALRAINM